LTARGVIAEMGYVALRTRDLAASVTTATSLLGLSELHSGAGTVLLSATSDQPEMVYTQSDTDGVEHLGLVAADGDELAAIRAKVDEGGWQIVDESPIADHVRDGFAFVGPEGYTWHIYTRATPAEVRLGSFGPDRYGHINIKVSDTIGMRDFLHRTFDFRVSDQIGDDVGFFMRCNPDHHGIAIIKSPVAGLHHHAWQTQSIADLGRLGDRHFSLGRRLIWGPVRHGPGHNMAAYYAEPNGTVVELYPALEQIWDEHRPPIEWDPEDRTWFNRWGVYNGEDFRSHGARPLGFREGR